MVLCPSPGTPVSQTDDLKKQVEENFGENIIVIQIKCLEKLNRKQKKSFEQSDSEKAYTELISILKDRINFKSLPKAEKKVVSKQLFKTPCFYILGWGRPNLVDYISEEAYLSTLDPLNLVLVNKVLSIANIEHNASTGQGLKTDRADIADPKEHGKHCLKNPCIRYFKGNKGKIIAEYIEFLKEKHPTLVAVSTKNNGTCSR